MTNATPHKITRFVSLLSCGIFVGVAATVLILELALRRLTGPEYVRVRQAEYDYFSWFVGAVFILTLIAVAMLVVYARVAHSPELRPAFVALVLLLLVLVISVTVNVPINVEQQHWSAQAPPADWARVRDRWQVAHVARTVAGAVALGYLGAASSAARAR